ncbi:hypothetical protein ABZY90_37825 [Streptomyces sp. NPDC006422]|uniref:hypothetical protein n=1 Tax=unclassified Streptomyces TaxID=2593676 RepID=UPI0033BAF8EE
MISELVDEPVAPPAPRPRTWVAPLVSSLITLPAALVAHVIAGASQMACDACSPAVAVRFERSVEWAFTVFGWGLTVSLLTLATAWLLPWEERFAGRRIGFSVAAPFAVAATFVLFLALVDWP